MNEIVREEIEILSDNEFYVHFWYKKEGSEEIIKKDKIVYNEEEAMKILDGFRNTFNNINDKNQISNSLLDSADKNVKYKNDDITDIEDLKKKVTMLEGTIEKMDKKIAVLWFIVICLPLVYLFGKFINVIDALLR